MKWPFSRRCKESAPLGREIANRNKGRVEELQVNAVTLNLRNTNTRDLHHGNQVASTFQLHCGYVQLRKSPNPIECYLSSKTVLQAMMTKFSGLSTTWYHAGMRRRPQMANLP